VSEGRLREFARFPEFASPETRHRIPDPQAAETRARSVLDWSRLDDAAHGEWLAFHRALLMQRAQAIVPLLAGESAPATDWKASSDTALDVAWTFRTGTLRLVANLGATAVAHPGPGESWGRRLYALNLPADGWSVLAPWSVGVYLAGARP